MFTTPRFRGRLGLAVVFTSLGLVATTAPAAQALPDWRTSATSFTNDHARQPKVIDLRYAKHARFDRVVIDVDGRRPGFTIKYTRKLTYDGSGAAVGLKGRKKMTISLNPAYAHNDSGDNVYEGPRLKQVKLPTLRGIAFTGDFEGYVSFGFSTDRKASYRVFTLTNPSRIVIDWKH